MSERSTPSRRASFRATCAFLGVAVLTFASAAARAQEYVHPERVQPLLARTRIARDAQAVRDLARTVANTASSPAARVHAARLRTEIEGSLAQDLRLGRSVQLSVEAGADGDWLRLVGTPFAQLDAARSATACAALARELHVISDDARWCAQRPPGEDDPTLPRALYVPGYVAEFDGDRVGTISVRAYASAEQAVARNPADRTARLVLAGMLLATRNPTGAVATLRGLPDDYEVSLTRALAAWASGDRARAVAGLVALVRADPARPEAAFDLAQLTIGVGALQFNRPPPADARRALALLRVASCGAARGMPGPAEIATTTIEWADRLQFMFERPSNWSGTGAWRSPVEGLARPRDSGPARGPPMVDCRAARERALALLAAPRTPSAPTGPTIAPAVPTPSSLALRAVRPLTSALVGPRPSFAWTGAARVVIELCAERDCATVRDTLRPQGNSPFRPAVDLPSGRHFWRVRSGASTSSVRVLWVAPHARGAQRIPDINCDGWPDVPLGPTGWYARFAPDGTPTLAVLPGIETATAHTFFAGDLNGDGCGDFAQVTGYGVQAIYGAPSGPMWPQMLGNGYTPEAELIGDLDGDGLDDLLFANNGALSVWSAGISTPVPFHASDAAPVGDVDGDGIGDLAASRYNSMTRSGTWGFIRASATGLSPELLTPIAMTNEVGRLHAVGDLDGDGRGDVVVFRSTADVRDPPGHFELHRGTRAGFETRVFGGTVAVDSTYCAVHPLGDVDGDGRDDSLWRERDAITWHAGSRRGLTAGTPLGAWPHDADLHAQRMPDAEPARVWIFGAFSTRAVRVDAGRATEVLLAPP